MSAELLVRSYGYWGILGISLTVGVFQPLPPDIFVVGGGGLGLCPYLAALAALSGTLAGGTVGYLLGRWVGAQVLVRWFRIGEKWLRKGERLFRRYGIWGVAIGAFLPLPLREICWAAGTFRMPLVPFLAALALGLAPKFFGLAILSKACFNFLRHFPPFSGLPASP